MCIKQRKVIRKKEKQVVSIDDKKTTYEWRENIGNRSKQWNEP
jgi:hypothetical protein